jgi:uncharacterized heparinase superfamily protein
VASLDKTNYLEHVAEVQVGASTFGIRISRAFQILRHYSWIQIGTRVKNIVRRNLLGPPKIKPFVLDDVRLRDGLDLTFLRKSAGFWHRKNGKQQNCELETGSFELLGLRQQLGPPSQWRSSLQQQSATHLWRFQLHYQEYLLSLQAVQNTSDREEIWSFVESWIDAFDTNVGSATEVDIDAWHPYCISRRVPVWLSLLAISPPASDRTDKIVQSLCSQVEHLRANLEHDLGGNHLLENLASIALAGVCLQGERTAQWRREALVGLTRQLDMQILEHGEHYELSPMYHCQILAQLLRIATLTRQPNGKVEASMSSLNELCLRYAKPMLDFIFAILHPDGEIPLLGDSGFGEAPSIEEIIWLADQNKIVTKHGASMSKTQVDPYYFFRESNEAKTDSSVLIFDTGEVAASHLPAHGHCDLLGLEASVEGHRWFVDSGNFNYENDSMRHYCRSSVAHNVMTIDNRNQCEVWSKFRMGRRGKVLFRNSGTQGNWSFAAAGHDSYKRSGFPIMERVVAGDGQCWVCVDNAPPIGKAKGDLVGYLHLSPRLKISEEFERDGFGGFELHDGDTKRVLRFFGVDRCRLVSGWYCPRFGERICNQVIEYRQTAGKGLPIGWTLRPPNFPNEISIEDEMLSINDSKSKFHWRFQSHH